MASSQQGDQGLVNNLFLAEYDAADHQSDFCDGFHGAFDLGDHFFVRFSDGWHVIHYIENSHRCLPFRVMSTEA